MNTEGDPPRVTQVKVAALIMKTAECSNHFVSISFMSLESSPPRWCKDPYYSYKLNYNPLTEDKDCQAGLQKTKQNKQLFLQVTHVNVSIPQHERMGKGTPRKQTKISGNIEDLKIMINKSDLVDMHRALHLIDDCSIHFFSKCTRNIYQNWWPFASLNNFWSVQNIQYSMTTLKL